MIVKSKCHCGSVELEIKLVDGFNTLRRCDCSFCRRRGAAAVSAPLDGIKIIKGAECLTLYQWNTKVAKHYFCSKCGVYTHHQRRSNPNEYGINVGTIEGINPRDFEPIPWVDGVNHPADKSV